MFIITKLSKRKVLNFIKKKSKAKKKIFDIYALYAFLRIKKKKHSINT